MGIRVFDFGRDCSKHAKAMERVINARPDIEGYVQGRIDQFVLDLFLTGQATMPDGKVVRLYEHKARTG